MNLPFVIYQGSRLSYYKYGSGQQVLLCFCGYGQTGADFGFLAPMLTTNYTLIAINWFGFEGSYHPPNKPFTQQHYAQLLNQILLKEGLNQQPISLLSFSIGIIQLLGCLQLKIWPVKHVIICNAPGFAFFNLIKFGVGTWLGKWFFNKVITKYQFFSRFINGKTGKMLFSKSKIKLVNAFVNYPRKLLTIKHTWQTLQPLLISKRELLQLNFGQLYHITGKYDTITPAHLLKDLLAKMGSNHIDLNTGHKLNTPEHINVLRNILLNP